MNFVVALKQRITSPLNLFLLILIVAAVLRFWGLGTAEIFHDEGFYAFRSIGYLDYVQNDDQTTPVQWFRNATLPWWTNLSFHDHPPFYFLIQHLFFKVGGDSLFVARLPSALAGLLAVFLVYLIGRRIFKNDYVGLAAAAILAVNHIHIWVSRSALMEPLLLALIFLNIYAFLRFFEDRRRFIFFGLTLGLCFLTKYTSFFLVPVYLVYCLIFNRRLLLAWQTYAAVILALAIFSPVLIYNFYLWQSIGHFDLQFAYLFHQATPEWRASLGKIQEAFSNIGANLTAMYSLPFLLATLAGFVGSLILLRRKQEFGLSLFWLALIFITLMLVPIGSAFRFISLYVVAAVFLVTLVGQLLWNFFIDWRIPAVIVAAFLLYETFFTVQGVFLTFPDYGVVKLDQYLARALGPNRSSIASQSANPHLNKVIQQFTADLPAGRRALTIIYDENIDLATRLWLFGRRTFYKGIPTASAGQFKKLLRERGADYFKNYEFYFIKASPYTILNPYLALNDAAELEQFLVRELKTTPQVIAGQKYLPMFYVYRFSI